MATDKIRFTGMNSGIDTEAVIGALVSSKKTKVDDAKKAQIKLEWKQEVWKDMNSKIYGLYSGKLTSMKYSTAYNKKVTSTSNSALSVVPGEGASEGVQTAKINKLAKTGYLTGGELSTDENGKAVSSNTKVVDLGIEEGTSFTIKSGENEKEITVTADMSLSDLADLFKQSGVKANFDSGNKRFFVSASATGEQNDFSFSVNDTKGNEALAKLGLTQESGATRIEGSDAELVLNGAKFTSSSNTFQINGSTYTVNALANEEISVTTKKDTSEIYNSIKALFSEYNDVMKSMSTAYNAPSAKGYEPLLDEEKESLSDKEVEKWEEKVKNSLLRRDSTLSGVMMAMKDAMSQGVEIDGKTYYLSDFGISTQGYMEAAENERYSYHISGDKDDSVSSGKEDILSAKITSDPELVTEFFTKLSKNLSDAMYSKMGSTDYSSIYKVYNDKQMKTEYDSYNSKIAELEEKLADIEDRYYKRFAQMEAALSKLNSSQSAISSLFNM
ncbi:MAG: flagellar filament capping protein FliD [Lachnospiraceae bacterium]|nr:flagellar filament capping protein FliD [Lachnospiraceae bacterium]